MFTNFCFSEILLVAAANRFKVLKIFISLKVTAYIQDRRLRSEKAFHIQGFEWKSNCTQMAKYTDDFKHKIEGERKRKRERKRERKCVCVCVRETAKLKTSPSSLLYIHRRHIQNPFQNVSKEGISSLEVTIFTKISILDV